jgi:hypothetical protein
METGSRGVITLVPSIISTVEVRGYLHGKKTQKYINPKKTNYGCSPKDHNQKRQ